MYVCSSYYKPHELARRNTIIQVFTSVGPLFSGFLMAATYAGLNGVNGLAGWRWMYMYVTPRFVTYDGLRPDCAGLSGPIVAKNAVTFSKSLICGFQHG